MRPARPAPARSSSTKSCDLSRFEASIVHVLPAPDATWVTVASVDERLVYRLTGGGETPEEAMPLGPPATGILLAGAADGSVHLVADCTTEPDHAGGLIDTRFANGAFSSSVVVDPDDRDVPVARLEIGSDGATHIWFASDAMYGETRADADGQGGWTMVPVEWPHQGAAFTLAGDGSIVSVFYGNAPSGKAQLHAAMGNEDDLLDSSYWPADIDQAKVASAPGPAASDLRFAVAEATHDCLRLLARSGTLDYDRVNYGLGYLQASCWAPSPNKQPCTSESCNEKGSGMERGAFSIASTDDGRVWLAYVVTDLDQRVEYSYKDHWGDGIEYCGKEVTQDSSTATLHLRRIPVGAGTDAEVEVLTMPIDRPAAGDHLIGSDCPGCGPRDLMDMRGFGRDLAIGLRTGRTGGPHAVRVIRIDTTTL